VAEASRAGKRALSRKPNFFLGLLMLANVARQTGNLDAAENFYWKALELTPLLPQAWTGLGDIARQRGNKAQAAECYERALSLDASWIDAAIALAEIQTENGDALHASQTLESLARNNPGSADAVFAQARFYEARGDIGAAVSSYQRALELDQDLSPGHYLVFASRHFTPREMSAAFEKYEDRLGDSPVLWGNYAWLLATSHDPATRDPGKALTLAERAFELASPKNAHVYRVLAAAYAANGDFGRASDAIDQASAFDDHSDDLGSVLSKMAESFSMRLPYLEAAKKKNPAD
jgi:tetratricopeptide (TPR) repeat protein